LRPPLKADVIATCKKKSVLPPKADIIAAMTGGYFKSLRRRLDWFLCT